MCSHIMKVPTIEAYPHDSFDFFRGNKFAYRADAIEYVKAHYEVNSKKLMQYGYRNNHSIFLKCAEKDCLFQIVCKKRKQDEYFTYCRERSFPSHGIPSHCSDLIGICGGLKAATTKDILSNPLFRVAKAVQSLQKNNHTNRLSSIGMKNVLASSGFGNIPVSLDCLKKANNSIQLSSLEHCLSYNYLIPFLELLASNNVGTKYKLIRDEKSFVFERVALLFPYSVEALSGCFKVYGVDTAHLDGLDIKGNQRNALKKYFAQIIPDKIRLCFKKMYISALSGRTLNNNMIVFAVSIGYSEGKEDYNFLFKFLHDNGFDIDQDDATVLSDRGLAVQASMKENLRKAFLKPCPIHLDRNLDSNGFQSSECHSLYWKATNAPTKAAYDTVIEEMVGTPKGLKLFEYLDKIENWQLYKARERGNTLYESKSDNVVEIVFAWMNESRANATPYYVLYSIVYNSMKLMSSMYERYMIQSSDISITAKTIGISERAYNIFLQNEVEVNKIAYEVVITDFRAQTGFVHRVDNNKFRVRVYNVNLIARTCDCGHWDQSGVPCYHAIALQRKMKGTFTQSHFYEFCHHKNVLSLFEKEKLLEDFQTNKSTDLILSKVSSVPRFESFSTPQLRILPTADSMEELIISNPDKYRLMPRLETIAKDDPSFTSSKRMGSTGEKNLTSKNVFKVRTRIVCNICQESFHKKTKHPISACLRNCRRKNIVQEFTPLL